jgi:FkbM family methyltransferase
VESARDAMWECRRVALGQRRGRARMHVSEDTRNSSIFEVGERHVSVVPDSRTLDAETVRVVRLDEVWRSVACGAQQPYLKIDTQGYELDVLRGTTRVLGAIPFVEVELSLLAVYDSARLFGEVLRFLTRHDFAPIAFEGVLDDTRTGEMLQADGIFRRVTGSILAASEIR